jgi:hypothetical protein|tara:strand:+ start:611 stop:853 length:243 start_codon:yes stop_codon:yes gene_type:complete
METSVENYLDLTIEEVYAVISNTSIWPSTFDQNKKIKLMTSMIKYFIDKEEYEKCQQLQNIIDELENNQQNNRRSRTESN